MKKLNRDSLSCTGGVKQENYCGEAGCLTPLTIPETLFLRVVQFGQKHMYMLPVMHPGRGRHKRKTLFM